MEGIVGRDFLSHFPDLLAYRKGRGQVLIAGSRQFPNAAVAVPGAEPAKRIGEDLLPTAPLKSLYVNNRDGFAAFKPFIRKN
jgi:hypothetical protein